MNFGYKKINKENFGNSFKIKKKRTSSLSTKVSSDSHDLCRRGNNSFVLPLYFSRLNYTTCILLSRSFIRSRSSSSVGAVPFQSKKMPHPLEVSTCQRNFSSSLPPVTIGIKEPGRNSCSFLGTRKEEEREGRKGLEGCRDSCVHLRVRAYRSPSDTSVCAKRC